MLPPCPRVEGRVGPGAARMMTNTCSRHSRYETRVAHLSARAAPAESTAAVRTDELACMRQVRFDGQTRAENVPARAAELDLVQPDAYRLAAQARKGPPSLPLSQYLSWWPRGRPPAAKDAPHCKREEAEADALLGAGAEVTAAGTWHDCACPDRIRASLKVHIRCAPACVFGNLSNLGSDTGSL